MRIYQKAQSEMARPISNRDLILKRKFVTGKVGDRGLPPETEQKMRKIEHFPFCSLADEPEHARPHPFQRSPGPNGEKILHIEELQCDLHQKLTHDWVIVTR